MADKSHIEWTDATWNPITGCSVVSPGCTNCYAMRLAGTRLQHHPSRIDLTTSTKAGPVWNGEVRLNEGWLDQPLRWSRPRRIFVCAHGDLFHPSVPLDWIAQVYGVAIAAVHLRKHIMQILTKRADRMRDILSQDEFWYQANYWADAHVMERVDPLRRRSDDARATLKSYDQRNEPPGIWLGVSVEDQDRADLRLPDLIETPAALRWISAEPLLKPLRLEAYMPHIDWVVAGGESGPGFRQVETWAFHDLLDQCTTHHTPFYMKQMPGKAEIPATLQIREWPGAL